MIEEKEKFYELSQRVLKDNGASSFADLIYKAFDNLHSVGIDNNTIDSVIKEFAPYHRYCEYREKEELLERMIKQEG